MKAVLTVTIAALLVGGCATKRYGRLTPLSGAEQAAYTCREVAIELAKVEAFQDAVNNGSKTNAASVAGFLGDFGVGNSMEKNAAERSAAERRQQLRRLEIEKNCASDPLVGKPTN